MSAIGGLLSAIKTIALTIALSYKLLILLYLFFTEIEEIDNRDKLLYRF